MLQEEKKHGETEPNRWRLQRYSELDKTQAKKSRKRSQMDAASMKKLSIKVSCRYRKKGKICGKHSEINADGKHSLKGTVARDFRPSDFFIKQSPLGP
jgi:hypothetical protein